MLNDDIYTLYNIDKSRLKRDYIKNPLKKIVKSNSFKKFKYELPYNEDVEYLFIELNLTLDNLVEIFNINKMSIRRQIKSLNIKKSKEMKNIRRELTTIKKQEKLFL